MTGQQSIFNQELAAQIEQLQSALLAANVGTWDYNLQTHQAQWSPICKQLFGLPADAVVTSTTLLQQVHPDDRDWVGKANAQVLDPASQGEHDIVFRISTPLGAIRWVEAKGKVLRDEQRNPVRFSGIVQEVTQVVLAKQRLAFSQQQLLTSFQQAPVGIALISGPALTFQMVNPLYANLAGRTVDQLVGQPLLEALPELAGQGFDALLHQVVATHTSYTANEVAVEIIRVASRETIYVDMTYQPQIDQSGVLIVCIDVTQQVKARQQIEEVESDLRGAIALADLGTWQLDLATGLFDYSERLRDWLGIGPDEVITIDRAFQHVREADRRVVDRAVREALKPGNSGLFDVEYTAEPSPPGQERVLRVQGRTFFTEKGNAHKVSGTVQDVTQQRQRQADLEQQVQQRTEQLQTYVDDLQRSNENLQQFAYIASHDLQEPLRKIQQFGGLLKEHYTHQLGEGVEFIHRMQAAASRMSTLIRDLLTYSRIATQRDTSTPVSLTQVINDVLTDLEISIQESGAFIQVDSLPMIMGDAVQLGQLFQNLLSNALKFRRPATVARIEVSSGWVTADNMPATLNPKKASIGYHRIEVSDNGIGFDDKYIDRIFQVFQRLHGKGEFGGTGIGLAICEKVVTNHGGVITARSQPGQGATFSVYLPV
jgi:PAS domain S-box-containing protein